LAFFPLQDEKCARDIAERAAFAPHVRVWKAPEDLLSWIPEYDVVIGTRFHALVLAAMSKVPFIGWGNQNKVAALCREHGKPYANTESVWNVQDQLNLISSLYQSKNKIVILPTRTS
jgi:polysaccharide pyruvyl transferase WcaK-like protein